MARACRHGRFRRKSSSGRECANGVDWYDDLLPHRTHPVRLCHQIGQVNNREGSHLDSRMLIESRRVQHGKIIDDLDNL